MIGTPDLVAEFEKKYFWWEPIGSAPRSDERIIAQAMDLGTFADIRRLEVEIGPDKLVDVMLNAQPGWLSERSWDFWRGRLSAATGRKLAEEPPQRSLHAAEL
ncbi:MAG: hypothetical protein HY244_15905 [Rhizobiales bacterium]|nr:hypothetical protein [Hyphomicrobiales bacterium]